MNQSVTDQSIWPLPLSRAHDARQGGEQLLLRGYDIDDELIVYDRRGFFVATPEGSQFVFFKFPGLPGYNSFHQFARTLNRPDLIRRILSGEADTPDPQLTAPPTVDFNLKISGSEANRSAKLNVTATSDVGLEKVLVFVDGCLTARLSVEGQRASQQATIALGPEARWVTLVSVDTSGHESVAKGQALPGAGATSVNRLFAVAIGTDTYEDKGKLEQLAGAKADAGNFAKAVKGIERSVYANVDVTSFLDATNLRSALPHKLREIVAAASDKDTIMLFAAGHGVRDDDGKFYLITRETLVDRLPSTAISWDEIAAALDGAKARVFAFLDACQSGAAGNGGANDDAVAALFNRHASITVIAAAKGRQFSYEENNAGRFTTALVRAITTNRNLTDTNGNGAIRACGALPCAKEESSHRHRRKANPMDCAEHDGW